MPDVTLRHSPIDDRHRALGATMTPFAGWDMPLDYGSVVAEHTAVRTTVGVFDLSHLGTLRVTGPDAQETVQRAFTNDVTTLPVGRAHYTLCLDDQAGIVDDLLVYHLPWGYWVVPNAANTAAVEAAMRTVAEGLKVAITDVKADFACLAVQGPDAAGVTFAVGLPAEDMAYLDCTTFGEGVLARSGYTGERGYEAFVPAADAPALWDRLTASGVVPVGLGARDTLRLEMGYPLHGNDISPRTDPVEAGLRWAVKPAAPFTGRDAYLAKLEAGPRRRLVGLRATERGIPRAHQTVVVDDDAVGETTSGTFSPMLKVGIAMAYVDTAVEVGGTAAVDVRGKLLPVEVVRPPFVGSNPKT